MERQRQEQSKALLHEEDLMDIGQPKRIIEIVPATLPIPGELEPAAPEAEPAVPEHVPEAPVPSERPA